MATAMPNPKSSAAKFENILFATDFSDYSRHAIPYVSSLAHAFGSRVFLCHVVTPSQLVIAAPEAAPYLYEAECRNSEEQLAAMADLPELKGLRTQPVMCTGLLEDELTDVIKQKHIDLIVLGTHGRTGLRRLVLGSAAEQVCRMSDCPVLTIGPDLLIGPKVNIRRIVVPVDFSPQSKTVLPYVAGIASQYGASVTFLHVIPVDAAAKDGHTLGDTARQTFKKTMAAGIAELDYEFLVEFGDRAETILQV
ncbi:MAG TPA: universal stress protein, partial [Candidatus Angelobacter sp.]|nr:universal stress protein [Candidatus Angelobacter sp.]